MANLSRSNRCGLIGFALMLGTASIHAGIQSPTQPGNQADLAADLKRTIVAQKYLAQFSKYVSLAEIPPYGGPVELLAKGNSPWPTRIDIDPRSQLRVDARFPAESSDALVDAGIREVCLRISADSRQSTRLSVTVSRQASVTLPASFAASRALAFEVESRSCEAPPTTSVAEISLAIRDRGKVQALAAVSQYTFHEVQSPSWQPTNGSKPPEILLEDDGFSLLVDKKSAVQIRAKVEDSIASQLRTAGVWSLCIEASWPNAKDGSKTDTAQIEVRANESGPATVTPPFVAIESRSAAYSLTVITREGGCKTPTADALNKRIYRVDVADLGLQLLPPVVSDAVIFGWTTLPDTDRPTSVKRAEQISKVGVNIFFWGDRFRKRDNNKLTRALRRAIGFNVTPGITVAGPRIANGGKQTAVSLGIVVAEPTTRAVFIGFGRLSFGPHVKNPGMIFVGVSGVELVKRIRGLP